MALFQHMVFEALWQQLPAGFWANMRQALITHGVGLLITAAGISVGLGTQTVPLMVNRISPARFMVHLLISATLYALAAMLWMVSIWYIGNRVFGITVALSDVLIIVSVAFAPLLYSALILLPYVGRAIGVLLNMWSLLLALVAGGVLFESARWQPFVCVLPGWLALQLVNFVMNRPTTLIGRWFWRITTGSQQWIWVDQLPPVRVAAPARQRPTPQEV